MADLDRKKNLNCHKMLAKTIVVPRRWILEPNLRWVVTTFCSPNISPNDFGDFSFTATVRLAWVLSKMYEQLLDGLSWNCTHIHFPMRMSDDWRSFCLSSLSFTLSKTSVCPILLFMTKLELANYNDIPICSIMFKCYHLNKLE